MNHGKYLWLVVIDAFSPFIPVYPVKSTAATHIIEDMTIFISFTGI